MRSSVAPGASPVPSYALYGEAAGSALPGALHCESIAQRSRLHDWEIRPHRHESFLQILLLRGGTGEARLDSLTVPIETPCVIVVPPGRPHGFRFSRDVDGIVLTVVAVRLRALVGGTPALWACFDAPRLQPLDVDSQAIATLLQAIADEFAADRPWRDEALGALFRLALLGLARLRPEPAPGPVRPGARAARHVARYRALIDRHYREHRPLAWYAERLGLTPTQLNRVCRGELGRSALGVAHDRLQLEAERDLVYSGLGVKAIADTLGFSDAAYFSRFFARRTGLTPSAFRTRAAARLARDAG